MDSNKVSVKIYGQDFVVAGDSSREHIMKVADYVDTKMHEIAGAALGGSSSYLAVLSAVNISDEYFTALERIKDLEAQNVQLERDSEHYVQLWEEAKKNFVQYKEDAQSSNQKKEELLALMKEKEREIQYLKDEMKLAQAELAERSQAELQEWDAKCRELESSFFDLQMENIQLKSELERYKKEHE